MPYFREMASKAIPPSSSSRTTSTLKASLYRISSRLPCVFVFIPDNLFQDGTVNPTAFHLQSRVEHLNHTLIIHKLSPAEHRIAIRSWRSAIGVARVESQVERNTWIEAIVVPQDQLSVSACPDRLQTDGVIRRREERADSFIRSTGVEREYRIIRASGRLELGPQDEPSVV